MKKLISNRRRKMLATFAAVSASALAGLVFAAWLTDSDGPGAGQIASLTPPTVTAGTFSGKALTPGGTGDGTFVIENPNNTDLILFGTAEPAVMDGTPPLGCPFLNLSVNPQSGLSINVPANATTPVTVPDVFRLSADAPDVCQGKSFTRTAKLRFQTPNGATP